MCVTGRRLDALARSVEHMLPSEEEREFETQPSQANDLHNLYLPLPSLALGMTRIGQGLVSSVSG